MTNKSKINSGSNIAVFKGQKVRRIIHNNEWWFVVNDVVVSLTDSRDPVQYFKRMKERDLELAKLIDQGGGTIWTTPYA